MSSGSGPDGPRMIRRPGADADIAGTDPTIPVRGQTIALLHERAALWVEAATLLVADTHFGKAATFRRAGLPVPRGTTTEALARLDSSLDRTAAARVIFLGDFLHAAEGREPETLAALDRWRDRHPGLELVLVRGNHDRHAGDPPDSLRILCSDAPIAEGPFRFAHDPRSQAGTFLFAGHIHPAVRLRGTGRQRARLPCFWFGDSVAVLPSFGDFTGHADVAPVQGDRVWVVVDGRVVPVEERG